MTRTPLSRSFGRAADRYESGRPDWPDAAVDAVGLSADSVVLDLGAGTGKLSRVLVSRYARVIAVEPLEAMRAVLEAVVPDAEVLEGSAEEIPLPDHSVDGVFSGDSFHWFDKGRALTEIARVLRPGGALAVFFSRPAEPTEPPIDGVHELLERHRRPREHPMAGVDSGEWLKDFSGSPFGTLRELRFLSVDEVSRTQMLDYFASVSWIAALERDEQDALLDEVGALLPDTTYRRSWETFAFMWRRR